MVKNGIYEVISYIIYITYSFSGEEWMVMVDWLTVVNLGTPLSQTIRIYNPSNGIKRCKMTPKRLVH
jgi:hypothetical protein